MEKNKKIPVVTGIGIICDLGIGKQDVKKNLFCNKSNFQKIENKGDYGTLNDFKIGLCDIEEPAVKNVTDMDKSEIMIKKTALEACKDAGFDNCDFGSYGHRAALSLATSLMGSEHIVSYDKNKRIDCKWLLYSKAYAARLASEWNVKGGVYTTSSACASGTAALGIAIDLIKNENCEIVLCGGTDHISEISLNGFQLLGTLSKDCCKPFDENRDGINIGEGSAFFIVEEYEHAKKRNAHIYGELRGYGLANDAYHITSPDPEGTGAMKSMEQALGSNIKDDIYVNAHGTGTEANDSMEMKAISNCFRNHNVYVSSTKALTGHCLGAAGSIELAFSLFYLEEGLVPKTSNSNCNMPKNEHILTKIPENYSPKEVLSNSFAFGGNDASVYIVK